MIKSVQSDLFTTAQRLSELFSTQPVSGDSSIPWKRREGIERELSFALGIRDKHVCVDGPSGSGKTSLVQRILVREKVPFIHIQISSDWDWPAFTRQFIDIPSATSEKSESYSKGFLNIFKPGIEVGAHKMQEYNRLDALNIIDKESSLWNSSDLSEWIEKSELVLVVDDLEQASEEILDKLAAVSKRLGQSSVGKVVFIGIDDVMKKLLSRNTSLNRRMIEITVGGLANVGESSSFIFDKFKEVGILTPNTDAKVSATDAQICRDMIYDAANGLMKDLNDLGMSLARSAENRTRLSVADIKKGCRKFIDDVRRSNRQRILGISRVLQMNPSYLDVFGFLIQKPSSSIIAFADISQYLSGAYREEEIESALDFLSSEGIVAVTGVEEIKVFFRDPPLFNCIRIHLLRGKDYGWDLQKNPSFLPTFGQLTLGLLGGRKTEKPD
ncbi:MAG: ATP-binding protein [Sphingomonadales bacterium]|nr:ATP-binding protein [Sphingomonadales bacterium]